MLHDRIISPVFLPVDLRGFFLASLDGLLLIQKQILRWMIVEDFNISANISIGLLLKGSKRIQVMLSRFVTRNFALFELSVLHPYPRLCTVRLTKRNRINAQGQGSREILIEKDKEE